MVFFAGAEESCVAAFVCAESCVLEAETACLGTEGRVLEETVEPLTHTVGVEEV